MRLEASCPLLSPPQPRSWPWPSARRRSSDSSTARARGAPARGTLERPRAGVVGLVRASSPSRARGLWTGASVGWNPASFRVFYGFGAIVVVPVLALGTVYLLAGRRAGHITAVVVALPGRLGARRDDDGRGRPRRAGLRHAAISRAGPRCSTGCHGCLAAVASGLGATVLLAGAVVSAVRLARRRTTRRLALANALIALGHVDLERGRVVQQRARRDGRLLAEPGCRYRSDVRRFLVDDTEHERAAAGETREPENATARYADHGPAAGHQHRVDSPQQLSAARGAGSGPRRATTEVPIRASGVAMGRTPHPASPATKRGIFTQITTQGDRLATSINVLFP